MSLPASLPTLAFLGIGLMGKPMATRLLMAGYSWVAWNRTHAKAEALTAFRGGFAESRTLEVHGQCMLDRNFMPDVQVKSQAKDLENILIATVVAGVALLAAELVTQTYRSILDSVPNAEQSAVLLALERLNPGRRVGSDPDKLP